MRLCTAVRQRNWGRFSTQGWTWLNLGSLAPVLVAGLALAWLAMHLLLLQNRAVP
jgi:hypothetical protein